MRLPDPPTYHIRISTSRGNFATYSVTRAADSEDTYLWHRSDARGPAGGAVTHDPDEPVQYLAARVLAAAGQRFTTPAPTMQESYPDDE